MRLALFDLDGTLLPVDSDHAFGQFLVDIGWADAGEFARANDEFYRQYQAGALDMPAYIHFATAPWRVRSVLEQQQAMQRFVEEFARPQLHPAAQALVQQHRQAGDLLVIITATNEFITRPIADLFGVPHLIATELERDAQGRVTGAIAGVPSYGAGKVARLQQWLAQRGQPLEGFDSVHFYSDSTNDLPLMQIVSHPVATNPSPALEREARQRGWPVLRLFEPELA